MPCTLSILTNVFTADRDRARAIGIWSGTAGLGVAIISAHTCMSEIADGHLIALQVAGLPLVRQWFLLNRVDKAPSMAAQKFRAFVLERRASLLPKV